MLTRSWRGPQSKYISFQSFWALEFPIIVVYLIELKFGVSCPLSKTTVNLHKFYQTPPMIFVKQEQFSLVKVLTWHLLYCLCFMALSLCWITFEVNSFCKPTFCYRMAPTEALTPIFGRGYSENVASVGWQLKPCDPIWHESSVMLWRLWTTAHKC